jgi:hypothetical protein
MYLPHGQATMSHADSINTTETRSRLKRSLLVIGCGVSLSFPLYFALHPYSPKSLIPILLGIIGSILILAGTVLYTFAKKVRALRRMGNMKQWLNVHILLCLYGPLLVIYHTAFTIKAPNSAVVFYAMLIVVISGLVGRYIYRHFQFRLSGERATLKEMAEEVDRLNQKIREHFSDPQKIISTITKFFDVRQRKASGLVQGFYLLLLLDWLEKKLRLQIRQDLRHIDHRIPDPETNKPIFESILIERISLEKKIAALEATVKLFGYWHQFHMPLTWIFTITLIVHIAAVLIF